MEKIGRTKIVDLLKRTDIGAMVNVMIISTNTPNEFCLTIKIY